MAFWNKKKEETVVKQTIIPTLPIMEGFGKISPSFIDIASREDFAKIFNTVSEVYSPIMYAGSSFSNMRLKLFKTDKDGQDKEQIHAHEILSRLDSPNPLSNWKDFLLLYYVNKKVFGNAYLFKYQPTGFKKISDAVFWVLPSQYVFPIPVNRSLNGYFKTNKKEELVKGYSFFNRVKPTQPVTWVPNEIMHTKEPNLVLNSTFTNLLTELLEGRSPLTTLSEPISNIKKAYEAQNVILSKRGALGILTPKNNKDSIGAITMSETQKQSLQDQFSKYGLGEDQWQYIISNVEMSWQAMTLPIRELMLFEGIENSMVAICNTLNFPIVLLNYLRGATFSNVNELKKSLYQDNIIPEANSFISQLNSFLGLSEQNLRLKADFSHIPVLQSEALQEAKKDKITINTILEVQTAIFVGKITINEARVMLSNVLSMSDEVINGMLSQNTQQNGNTNI